MILNYRLLRHPGALSLLLVHPLGSDLRFWDECVALWGRRFTTLAVDLRSAGVSPGADRPMDADAHVDDLLETCDAVGLADFAVIGCALGGMVGARLAARQPDRVTALVMANPGVGNTPAAREMLRQRAVRVRIEGIAPLLPDAPDHTFHNLPHDRRFERYVEAFAALDPERYAQAIEGFLDIDITADIPRLACPLLLVPAKHDLLMAPESTARIKELAPEAEIVSMADAAHFAPYQAPATFADITADFFVRRLQIPR